MQTLISLKTKLAAFGLLFVLLGFQAAAAASKKVAMADLAGQWNVSAKTQTKVKKLGSATERSRVSCRITADTATATSGTFDCSIQDDQATARGGLSLLNKGKKLRLDFDPQTVEGFEADIEEWIVNKVRREGDSVDPVSIRFNTKKIASKPLQVKNVRSLTGGEFSLSGTVYGVVNGRAQHSPFTYKVTFSFKR